MGCALRPQIMDDWRCYVYEVTSTFLFTLQDLSTYASFSPIKK